MKEGIGEEFVYCNVSASKRKATSGGHRFIKAIASSPPFQQNASAIYIDFLQVHKILRYGQHHAACRCYGTGLGCEEGTEGKRLSI